MTEIKSMIFRSKSYKGAVLKIATWIVENRDWIIIKETKPMREQTGYVYVLLYQEREFPDEEDQNYTGSLIAGQY